MRNTKGIGRGAMMCLVWGGFLVGIPVVTALVDQDKPVMAASTNTENKSGLPAIAAQVTLVATKCRTYHWHQDCPALEIQQNQWRLLGQTVTRYEAELIATPYCGFCETMSSHGGASK